MTTEEMLAAYEVLGFAMYQCVVQRKSDGAKGTLLFDNVDGIRQYHSFLEVY
jgi:hypothetical protein